MSYSEQAAIFTDNTQRTRIEMCVREQAFIFAADGRPDIKALAVAVVADNYPDIAAMIAAVIVGPNSADLDDDGALLAAVQGAWPTVAAARYPA